MKIRKDLLNLTAKANIEELENIMNEKFASEFEDAEPNKLEVTFIHKYLNDVAERQDNIDRDVMQDHLLSLDVPFKTVKKYCFKKTIELKTIGDMFTLLCTGGDTMTLDDKILFMKAIHKYLSGCRKHVPNVNFSMKLCVGYRLYARLIRGKKIQQLSIKNIDGKVKTFIISTSQIKKIYNTILNIESGAYRGKYIDTTFTFYTDINQTKGFNLNIFSNGSRVDMKYGNYSVTVYNMVTNEIVTTMNLSEDLAKHIIYFYNVCNYLALPEFNKIKLEG